MVYSRGENFVEGNRHDLLLLAFAFWDCHAPAVWLLLQGSKASSKRAMDEQLLPKAAV